MKVFKFLPPYKKGKSGSVNFPKRDHPGVYIIKENNVIVYVGYSATNLYKTLYRHFQVWNDRTRERLTYYHASISKSYTVRVIYCTEKQAARLEKILIWRYEPRDNKELYDSFNPVKQDITTFETYEETPIEREAPF